MIYPTWLQAVLFVGLALDTYFMTQTAVPLSPVATLVAGAVNVGFGALLAFQKQVTLQVRKARGQ